MGAYSRFTKDQIIVTIRLIRYYRDFIRSDYELARNPYNDFNGTMTKERAQRELTKLVNIAINRKAGIPDNPYKKSDYEYEKKQLRDKRSLEDIKRIRLCVRQFETNEVKKRYAHLLSDDIEDCTIYLSRLDRWQYWQKYHYILRYKLPGYESVVVDGKWS